jgi:hypothetical protein
MMVRGTTLEISGCDLAQSTLQAAFALIISDLFGFNREQLGSWLVSLS